jgi:hypothetical protein
MTNRLIAFGIICVWQCGLLAHVAVAAEEGERPKAADVLGKAADVFSATRKPGADEKEIEAANRKFVSLLQSIAAHFESVTIGTESGAAIWRDHVLNKDGKGVDCVRFRTPKGEPRDLAWSFMTDGRVVEAWYLAPVKGDPAPAFKNFLDLTADRPDAPNVFVQWLSADALKPDTEYLLWFKFQSDKPVELMAAINLLPKGQVQNTAEDLSKAVALKDALRDFVASREKPPGKAP